MRSSITRFRRRRLLGVMAVLAVPPAAGAQTRFAWPTRQPAYAEYNVEQCVAAVDRAREYAAWDARRDTLGPAVRIVAPEYLSVVETARQCTAHLAIGQLPRAAQLALLHLWVAGGEDALYLKELRAGLTQIQTPVERVARLKDEVLRLLDLRPARVPLADTLIAELDRLGPPAGEAAFAAHMRRATLARDMDDFPSARQEVRRSFDAESAFRRFDSTWVQRDPKARGIRAITELWAQHLVPRDSLLRRNGPEAFFDSWRHDAGIEAKRWHLSARDSADLVSTALRGGGQSAPPLQADFWFGPADRSDLPSTRRVTLVVFVDERCGAGCYEEYGAVRRLKRRFGERLDVVLVTNTKGYFREHPPLDPAAEADVLREYFLDELGLPAMLAVVNAPFNTLPAPDQRRFYSAGPVFGAYDVIVEGTMQPHLPAFLIAPKGLLVGRRDLSEDETEVQHLIADLLAYQDQHE